MQTRNSASGRTGRWVLQLLLPDVCLASQMKFHVSNNVVNLSTADGRMSGITQECEQDKCKWPLKK